MSANDRQVGGEHYKLPGSVEHWDIVIQYQLNYFEAQILRYVMRCRKKQGVIDLEKAKHFLEKYVESWEQITKSRGQKLAEAGFSRRPTLRESNDDEESEHEAVVKKIKETCSHEHLPEKPQHSTAIAERFSDETFSNEGYYGDLTELYRCRRCGEYFRAKGLDGAHEKHGHCAGKSYLAQ